MIANEYCVADVNCAGCSMSIFERARGKSRHQPVTCNTISVCNERNLTSSNSDSTFFGNKRATLLLSKYSSAAAHH